jgi:hypothetical protein
MDKYHSPIVSGYFPNLNWSSLCIVKKISLAFVLSGFLVACGDSDLSQANATDKNTVPDTPPAEASCVGWQGSLMQGRRTDDIERCLRDKALQDRHAAVADAKQLANWEIKEGDYSALLPLIAVLTQFPTAEGLEAYLRELNLLPNKPGEYSQMDRAVSAADYLQEMGNIYWFDAETGMFPNNHDNLMSEVAALSDLKDAEFFETAPSNYDADDEPYQLRAELDGKSYQRQAENYGDWYDIEAVLALLNRVAVEAKRASRFTLLPTGDQTAIIWVADAATLATLHQRGLVGLSDANLAMVTGKAFEEEVKKAYPNSQVE